MIIHTDDYSDPAELIRIMELALWGDDDQPVKLRVEKVQLMPSTAHSMAVASIAKDLGINSSDIVRDWDRLVKWEKARLKRIYAQECYSKAGELAPGSDEYRRTLEELGVLPRIEPLVEEQSS